MAHPSFQLYFFEKSQFKLILISILFRMNNDVPLIHTFYYKVAKKTKKRLKRLFNSTKNIEKN